MPKYQLKDPSNGKTYIRTKGGKVAFGLPGRAKRFDTEVDAINFREALAMPSLEVVPVGELVTSDATSLASSV